MKLPVTRGSPFHQKLQGYIRNVVQDWQFGAGPRNSSLLVREVLPIVFVQALVPQAQTLFLFGPVRVRLGAAVSAKDRRSCRDGVNNGRHGPGIVQSKTKFVKPGPIVNAKMPVPHKATNFAVAFCAFRARFKAGLLARARFR